MLVAGYDIHKINKLKKQLSWEFEMKDLWVYKQIVCMSIVKDKALGTLKLFAKRSTIIKF